MTTTGNVMSCFGKIFFFLYFGLKGQAKKRYFLINSEGFEVSGSPTSIIFYMNKASRSEINYKTMKINFLTFAESTIQSINLMMISGEHNGLFFFSEVTIINQIARVA